MGERQRIGIGLARAIMLRPHWLLPDESASALDPAPENKLLPWLDTELPDSTTFTISHQRPTGIRLDATLQTGQPEKAAQKSTKKHNAKHPPATHIKQKTTR